MNWGAFALTFLGILLCIGGFVGTWMLLDWVRDNVGLGAAFVCAFIGLAFCIAALVGLNA